MNALDPLQLAGVEQDELDDEESGMTQSTYVSASLSQDAANSQRIRGRNAG